MVPPIMPMPIYMHFILIASFILVIRTMVNMCLIRSSRQDLKCRVLSDQVIIIHLLPRMLWIIMPPSLLILFIKNQPMKQSIYAVAVLVSGLLLACEKDNLKEPASTLSGRIVYEGQPI